MHHGVDLGPDFDERSDQKSAGVSEDKREAPVCAAQKRGHQQEFQRNSDQPATHLDRELGSHAPPFYDGTLEVDPRIDAGRRIIAPEGASYVVPDLDDSVPRSGRHGRTMNHGDSVPRSGWHGRT